MFSAVRLLFLIFVNRRLDKTAEQRMRTVGTGLQLRMRLCGDKEGMLRQFAHFNDAPVRRKAGQLHSVFRQDSTKILVDLIAVPVPFLYRFLLI